jgi:hypothetical protein
MKLLITITMLLIVATQSHAQNFPVSAPSHIQVIEELVYPIKVFQYLPQVKVLDVKTTSVVIAPEVAVVRYLRAMAEGDDAGAYASWDAESVRIIDENEKRMGRSKSQRQTYWLGLFKGKSISLVRKAEYQGVTFIEFTLNDKDKVILTDSVAVLHTATGGYQMTMKYFDSAVSQGWRNENKRVQRLAK